MQKELLNKEEFIKKYITNIDLDSHIYQKFQKQLFVDENNKVICHGRRVGITTYLDTEARYNSYLGKKVLYIDPTRSIKYFRRYFTENTSKNIELCSKINLKEIKTKKYNVIIIDNADMFNLIGNIKFKLLVKMAKKNKIKLIIASCIYMYGKTYFAELCEYKDDYFKKYKIIDKETIKDYYKYLTKEQYRRDILAKIN